MSSLWQRIVSSFFQKVDPTFVPPISYMMDKPIVNGINLLGLTIAQAKRRYPGIVIRVVCENGKSIMKTDDCWLWRHNVETKNGKIVKVNHNC